MSVRTPEPLRAEVEPVAASVRETTPGYKTTELYVAIGVVVLLLLDVIPASGSREGLYSTIAAASYVLSRGLAKLGVPAQVLNALKPGHQVR